MQQYLELKSEVPDALLFFRMGDFYELFGDDAVRAAQLLDITLTSRDKNKENPIPMAGVPHHSAQGYIQKLLDNGLKVAIGEQVEEPTASRAAGKTIVKREIVRVLTPGIQFEKEGSNTQYIACAVTEQNGQHSLACVDASTGDTRIAEGLTTEQLQEELAAQPIRHWIRFGSHCESEIQSWGTQVWTDELPGNTLSIAQARELLARQWQVSDLRAFFGADATALALGAVLHTLFKTQRVERMEHLLPPRELRDPGTLRLAPSTPEHLDLEDLYAHINHTASALGARRLRQWLWAPLLDPVAIAHRQDAVRYLNSTPPPVKAALKAALNEVYDLERILARLETGLIQPRDTLALGRTLCAIREICAAKFGDLDSLPALLRSEVSSVSSALSEVASLSARIVSEQRPDAPMNAREGGVFARGFNPELDRLLDLQENGNRWLLDLELKEREQTGIASLKVRYNRVFGYYIEVTSTHLKSVPAHYQRKQTMVGAERFFTEELKKFEEEILTAQSRVRALEEELFRSLCAEIRALQTQGRPISRIASFVATLDALRALAALCDERGYAFPVIDASRSLAIRLGRHPLVDLASNGRFVPNSLELGETERRCMLITGPNMGGKSTIMRQTALIVLMGQIGAPVPAQAATWGAVTQIFTRIGAQDAIARGQSTFMVEMTELAHILHRADERALVILDEIGRGTSTYDGISVAWATLEYICKTIDCRTLFATHYHELTHLTGELPGLTNAHLAVRQTAGELKFLYQLQEGPTNDSFGIHVAKMAGIPKSVITRAWKILEELEQHAAPASSPSRDQLNLFSKPESPTPAPALEPWLEELATVNVNEMTPLQALQFVAELQEKSRALQAKFS